VPAVVPGLPLSLFGDIAVARVTDIRTLL